MAKDSRSAATTLAGACTRCSGVSHVLCLLLTLCVPLLPPSTGGSSTSSPMPPCSTWARSRARATTCRRRCETRVQHLFVWPSLTSIAFIVCFQVVKLVKYMREGAARAAEDGHAPNTLAPQALLKLTTMNIISMLVRQARDTDHQPPPCVSHHYLRPLVADDVSFVASI